MKYFNDIMSFWETTWNDSKVLFFAEAIGAFASASGAVVLAYGTPSPNLWLAYTLYTVGSIGILMSSYMRGSAWMITLMCFFIMTNIFGIWRLL